jgi:hypothetical protein
MSILVAFVAASSSACTWVELTPAAEQVQVSEAAAVESCERIGRTKTHTSAKAWIFPRREEKVLEELRRLARDDAAEMGGTDVVPLDDAADGDQEFAIYRCPGSGGE